MEYQELTYQQMLQVLEDGKICHVGTVLNGMPYLLPMCYCWHIDGCTPVVELRAYHDGDLLQALAQQPQAILHFSRRVRGGVESVLLRGNVCVQLPQPPCESRRPQNPWQSEGRVRFDMPEGSSCSVCQQGGCSTCRQNGCSACQQGGCSGSCNGSGCNRDCDGQRPQFARITVTAVEMTGRCVPACLAGCRQE